ncbi:MAG: 3'-5' exonuclease [Rhodocyclaceae bacterium]|nr:3'-5' exonuclease [Rhodocyclaceae bacterium]
MQLSRSSLITTELAAYPGIALADVSLVVSDEQADAALMALLGADVIGFDTESKPTFLKGEVSTGPHLIQLATETRAYLFPISWTSGHAVLKTILESPLVVKVGFGLGNDRAVLRSRLGIEVHNLIDMGEVLRGPGHRGTVGAKVAVAHFFGQKLQKHKRIGTSNWASRRLTAQQLLYAANDAQVALRVYRAWRETQEGQGRDETLNPPTQGLD